MRVTIKDIAEKTGFSVTTVSLVLNGKGNKISQNTKEIIMKAAENLDYRPNQLAVGLVKRRTQTIGLIISDVSNVFFGTLAKGVEDACRSAGWNLILCNTNDQHKREEEYIKVLADKGVDGIILCMSRDNNKEKVLRSANLLHSLNVPFVMVDRYLEEVECSSVIVNHSQGGYIATKYLLDQGHRRIACITGPSTLRDSMKRLEGYRRALDERGIAFDESLIFEGNYDYQSGENAITFLFGKRKSLPTAVFAFNDMSVYGAYTMLRKKGICVPDDVSLVGYDDIFFSQIMDVPLTTVRQPVYDLGLEAVDIITDIIETGVDPKKTITFQTNLIIRDSVKRRLK